MTTRTPVSLAAHVLFAPSLVVAFALLVKGHAEPGGGFAAGMVASLGTLLQYVGLGTEEVGRRFPWTLRAERLALVGLAVMAATALAPVLGGHPPVWHLPRPGSPVTELGPLALHTTLLFEAGIALATFGFAVCAMQGLAEAQRGRRP